MGKLTAANWSPAKQAQTACFHRRSMRGGLASKKFRGSSPPNFLCHIYPLLLLLVLLLLPPPLLLLLLVLVAGDDTFFNTSYQKDAPCETATAVMPSPSAFQKMNKAHASTSGDFGNSCVCHQPILMGN